MGVSLFVRGIRGMIVWTALVAAGGAQHTEMQTQEWTTAIFRKVAEGIAGHQWAAYLRVLWYGTALADRAATIGMNIGLATLLWEDICSQDVRYMSLTEGEQREALSWAIGATAALHQEKLRCIDAVLKTIEPTLNPTLLTASI